MKITLESRDGDSWHGQTDTGIQICAHITRIEARQQQDCAELTRQMQQRRAEIGETANEARALQPAP